MDSSKDSGLVWNDVYFLAWIPSNEDRWELDLYRHSDVRGWRDQAEQSTKELPAGVGAKTISHPAGFH